MKQFYPLHNLFISACFILLFYNTLTAQPAVGTTSFATTTVQQLVTITPCTAGGQSGVHSGYRFRVFSAENCAINNAFHNPDSDGHINLISAPAVTGIWQEAHISSSDDSRFKLDHFDFSALSPTFVGKTITVTGYRNGSLVTGASITSPPIAATSFGVVTEINFGSVAAFSNIDEFRLTPSGSDAQGTLAIRSITISPAVTGTLPVTFSDVQANRTNNGINVLFTTHEERNIDNYDIQTSTDAILFTTATSINAKNAQLNHYESNLNNISGNVWVRVVANEMDGTKKYANVVQVKASARALVVYPNPAKEFIYVRGAIVNKQYTISDLQGRTLQKGIINNQLINIQNLSTGSYILTIDGMSFKTIKH